jgi:hypothetical protein
MSGWVNKDTGQRYLSAWTDPEFVRLSSYRSWWDEANETVERRNRRAGRRYLDATTVDLWDGQPAGASPFAGVPR